MWMARTYFLENIAKEEERRYSVYSSVTSCLEMPHCLTKICFWTLHQTTATEVFATSATRSPLSSGFFA